MTIESLARRIENAADPDRYCTAVAACLERNGGDLEGAIELAETVQMDELFERVHPRDDGGKFRNKSERMKAKHARERETRRPERKPRDTGPKSSNRQAVEQAMEDPELRQHLVGIASKIGTDLRSQIDPEDVVQTAMARALKEADSLELTNIPGWLRKKTEESLRDATKGARAFKRGRGHKHMSLDEELDHAERIGQAQGHDPVMVIGQAMSKLAESDPKGAKLLSAYYGLKRMPKNRHTDAERKRAERARAKLIPMMKEIYGKLGEPPEPTARDREDVPGIPTGEFAPGPKRKPAETRMPEDREWRKAGMTAAAHEGKVWHRKSPERIAVKKLAKHLNLSPEQTQAIHNIVKKPAQFADRIIGPASSAKTVRVQERREVRPSLARVPIYDGPDCTKEPRQDYQPIYSYARPARFGKSFAKAGERIPEEHETERFLHALGVPVPSTRVEMVPQKYGPPRPMKVADWLPDMQNFDRNDPTHRKLMREHLVAHAILGNEDLSSTNVKVGPQGIMFMDLGPEGISDNRHPAALLHGMQQYFGESLDQEEQAQQVAHVSERFEHALQHISSPERREMLQRRLAQLQEGQPGKPIRYWPRGEPDPRLPKPKPPKWPAVAGNRPFSEEQSPKPPRVMVGGRGG